METAWFTLGFILSFGAGIFFWAKRKRMLMKGIMTDAEVIDVFKSGGHYYSVVRFVTSDQKEIIQKHDVGNFKNKFKKGDRVSIYYHHKNPRKFMFVGKMEKWTPIILLATSFFILLVYFIFFKK